MRRRKRWAIDAMYIAVIALFDLVVCVSIVVSLGTRWWFGKRVWDTHGAWCKFTAISFNGATVITLAFTGLLATVRYRALVQRKQINSRTWLMVGMLLMVGLVTSFIDRGLNGMLFVLPAGFYCTPQYWGLDIKTVAFGLINIGVLVPALIAIPWCYAQITIYYSHLIRSMHDIDHSEAVSRLKRNTAYLALVLIAYSICIFPEFFHILISIIKKVKRTALSDGIVMLLLACVTLINPLFALLLHDEFRLEFMILLKLTKRSSYY
ncbi:hypothetical protein L0F63_001568 [Massospora cicadina]|nr:hypothetical protein L0F63_001568 [Massospora cicadina]